MPTTLRNLLRDRGANVAITFALALVPAIFLIGMGMDFASAVRKRAQLNAAADAAALAAVSSTMMQQSASAAQTAATNVFNTMAAAVTGLNTASTNATIVVGGSGLNRTVSVSYTAASINSFPSILMNNATWSISGSAKANGATPAYINFYLLLDDSSSMGIGATPTDIANIAAPNGGCGFACHSPNALSGAYPGYTEMTVPGTTTRLDALVSATSQLISTAIKQETVANQFKIGLYTFDNTVTTVSAPSTNLTQVQTLNAGIQLPTSSDGTQIGDAVNWLSQNVVPTTTGAGTQAQPIEFVFLVTDGVEDHVDAFVSGGGYDTLQSPMGYWCNGSTTCSSGSFGATPATSVMQSSACTSVKNKGVTVAVLYLNYDPLADWRYTELVQPFVNNIQTALQACASPGFFFQADHASDIQNAMQLMFQQAMQLTARLTQ